MSKMIHRPLILGIHSALESIFNENRYSDKTLQYLFKNNKQWGAKDRRLVAEGTYEIVRWWRKYNRILDIPWDKPKYSTEDFNQVVGLWLSLSNYQVPEWLEFGKRVHEIESKISKIKGLADTESIPDWLDEQGSKELGGTWPSLVTSLNRQAEVYLRANTLRVDSETLLQKLQQEHIECILESSHCLKLKIRKNVFTTEAFKQGLFEVQDKGSQMIVPLLEVKPGDRVVDACAGAGGKSLQLACEMKNKGKIIALDVHDWKLKELHKRAKRNGVDIIEIRAIDSNKTIKRLNSSCDKLLLDVPCSGLGVLRRNPDTKWKMTLERLFELKQLQADILSEYSFMVKPGGKMVYATCSLLPSENEEQVQKFLAQTVEWTLVKELKINPADCDSDAFYAALLQKRQ